MFSQTSSSMKKTCSKSNKIDIRKKRHVLDFNSKTIIQGIILSEILGKPKGQKGMVAYYEHKGSNSR